MHRLYIVAAALLITTAGVADAQLDASVRQCIDGYNNALRLVSQQAGKSARACLRAAAKGTESDPDQCVAADGDGKIAAKEARVASLYSSGKCAGSEPIQRGADIGNAAHRGAVTDLVHDLFGDPVTAAVVGLDATDSRCVDMTMKRGVQAFAAIVKGHRQCKKSGLESGAVTDAATLDLACGTLAQLDVSGKAQQRMTKLAGDVETACAASTAGLATLFSGLDAACHADGAALGDCVAARTSCRACLAVNEADGQHIDCDLLDDGADNASCFAFDLGSHTCTFAPTSQLLILNTALPLSITLSGAATISCGVTDADQVADCSCALNSVAPFVLPAIGDVCISPAPGCAAGSIDCDGGAPRDVDMESNHNLGSCTSNANCAATCDATCAGLGTSYVRRASGCEGFCQGGANNESACTRDSDCPAAECVGSNPVSHPGVCNCICEGSNLGAAGGPGEGDCALGMQLRIELPSDGDCLDTAVETLPPVCVGVTTATATGINRNAENIPGFNFPAAGSTIDGAALACSVIEGGSVTALNLVGHTNFFDSTLGDNFARFSIVCE